jgi:hypothetical protein
MFLRVVSKMSRWDGSKPVNRPEAKVCGDAITDLKTSENMLSIWMADSDEQIDESAAVVALGRTKLDKVCYVLLDNDALNQINLLLKDNKGECRPVIDDSVLERHRDVIELDSAQLESLSAYMLDQVRHEKCSFKSSGQLKKIITKMISEKKVDPSRINDKLKVELGL